MTPADRYHECPSGHGQFWGNVLWKERSAEWSFCMLCFFEWAHGQFPTEGKGFPEDRIQKEPVHEGAPPPGDVMPLFDRTKGERP